MGSLSGFAIALAIPSLAGQWRVGKGRKRENLRREDGQERSGRRE